MEDPIGKGYFPSDAFIIDSRGIGMADVWNTCYGCSHHLYQQYGAGHEPYTSVF